MAKPPFSKLNRPASGSPGIPNLDSSTIRHPANASTNTIVNFMRELDRINMQQLHFTHVIESEKIRSEKLDNNIREARQKIMDLKEVTFQHTPIKNGQHVNKKNIILAEKKIETAKIRFSLSRTENAQLKDHINSQRQEKQMRIKILVDIENEILQFQEKHYEIKKEIQTVNEKKNAIKSAGYKVKGRLTKETEEFSRDLESTKQALEGTQENILSSIREKVSFISSSSPEWHDNSYIHSHVQNSSYDMGHGYGNGYGNGGGQESPNRFNTFNGVTSTSYSSSPMKFNRSMLSSQSQSSHSYSQGSIHTLHSTLRKSKKYNVQKLLQDTDCSDIDDFIQKIHETEETAFLMYRDIQTSIDDLYKIENENKEVECKVEVQVNILEEMENTNLKIRNERQQMIDSIQSSVVKFESNFIDHMELITSISEALNLLIKNVSKDDDIRDQHLVQHGVSERNIEEFLSVLEERIDEIVQLIKAINKESLENSDFLTAIPVKTTANYDVIGGTIGGAASGMTLPTLEGEDDNSIKSGQSTIARPINIQTLKGYLHRRIVNNKSSKAIPIRLNITSSMKQQHTSGTGTTPDETTNANTNTNQQQGDISDDTSDEDDQIDPEVVAAENRKVILATRKISAADLIHPVRRPSTIDGHTASRRGSVAADTVPAIATGMGTGSGARRSSVMISDAPRKPSTSDIMSASSSAASRRPSMAEGGFMPRKPSTGDVPPAAIRRPSVMMGAGTGAGAGGGAGGGDGYIQQSPIRTVTRRTAMIQGL
eukprot:gene6966-14144_t